MNTGTATEKAIEKARRELADHGYEDIAEHRGIKVGSRVRHVGERYPDALRRGTGVVRALTEKNPSTWAAKYGGPDIELIIECDEARFGNNRVGGWANYHTVLIGECYWCFAQVAADGSCKCNIEEPS